MGMLRVAKRQAKYWWKKMQRKKPLGTRVRESAWRKGRRFVIGSQFVLWGLNTAVQLLVAELLLWVVVWWASALCVLDDAPVVNFAVPCVISGFAQLLVREPLADAVGKHTLSCAAKAQHLLRTQWDNEGLWVAVKTGVGLATSLAVIGASRAGMLDGPLLEIATVQVALTTFIVDLLRKPDHPLRRCGTRQWEHWFGRPDARLLATDPATHASKTAGTGNMQEAAKAAMQAAAMQAATAAATMVTRTKTPRAADRLCNAMAYEDFFSAAEGAAVRTMDAVAEAPDLQAAGDALLSELQTTTRQMLPDNLRHYFVPSDMAGRWRKVGDEDQG
jgi:hypothetical protein